MCLNCAKRFTTFERVAELDLRVVKKDGSRELFQPEKIRKGIERACWKRPIPTEQVERILMEVVQQIYLHEAGEIDSDSIGQMVMQKLIELDDVAYIRFASVYRFCSRSQTDFGSQPNRDAQKRNEQLGSDSEFDCKCKVSRFVNRRS